MKCSAQFLMLSSSSMNIGSPLPPLLLPHYDYCTEWSYLKNCPKEIPGQSHEDSPNSSF